MKILFKGLKPSTALGEALASQGISYLCADSLSNKKSDFSMVVEAISTISERVNANSRYWHVAVVTSAFLKRPNAYAQLLSHTGFNDIWLKESWELLFWVGLKRMVQWQSLQAEHEHLAVETELVRAHLEEINRRIEKDVDLASEIHRAMLPNHTPQLPGVALSVKYLPSSGLGGDYYDIFEYQDKRKLAILLADSKTHGMAAALLSVLLKVKLEEMKDRFPSSQDFIGFLNTELINLYQNDLAPMSLLFAVIDRQTLKLNYTSAGDLTPFLWRQEKQEAIHQRSNPKLGSGQAIQFRETEVLLRPGDFLIFHSDGLQAPLGGKDCAEALSRILSQASHKLDPINVRNELLARIDAYLEKNSLADDLTLINLAVDPKALFVAGGEKRRQSR